jgi:hypothetical protein
LPLSSSFLKSNPGLLKRGWLFLQMRKECCRG